MTELKGEKGEGGETDFKSFIKHLLATYCNLDDKIISELTSPENLKQFEIAFTTKYRDPDNNYELYELIGDKVLSYNIQKYILNTFPIFRNVRLIKFFDKIKQKAIEKFTFSRLAKKLGFLKYINRSYHEKEGDEFDLLEDTFESFCGCVETLIDNIVPNAGSIVIYQFVSKVFGEDKELFKSLKYDDVYDSITKLKENINDKGIGTYSIEVEKGTGKVTGMLVINRPYHHVKKFGENGEFMSTDKKSVLAKRKIADEMWKYAKEHKFVGKSKEIEDYLSDENNMKIISNVLYHIDLLYSCKKKISEDTKYKDIKAIIIKSMMSIGNMIENYSYLINEIESLLKRMGCDEKGSGYYPHFPNDAYMYFTYYLNIRDKDKSQLESKCQPAYDDLIKAFTPLHFIPVKNYVSFQDKIKAFVQKEKTDMCYYKHVYTILNR